MFFSSYANGIIDNCVEVFNQMNKVDDISIDDQALYEADREVVWFWFYKYLFVAKQYDIQGIKSRQGSGAGDFVRDKFGFKQSKYFSFI